jgi:putative ABC transport system ATP-binding protein
VAADPPTLIAVERLAKTYGRGTTACRALRGVSFDIAEGEWVSVMGPSGSGKTTLLNVLGALDAHYEGSVRIGGRELKRLGDAELSRFRGETIGFVFQHFNLLPHLSTLENVMIPGAFGRRNRSTRRRATELLERVGLADKLGVRPQQLSGGQQQRVAIARALFNHTRIILADEPTGALDRQAGAQILDLFASLNQEDGISVIVVTHEPYISARAPRILRLEDGLLVSDGPSDGAESEPPPAQPAEPSPSSAA